MLLPPDILKSNILLEFLICATDQITYFQFQSWTVFDIVKETLKYHDIATICI